jgi:hypothetical protein
VPPRSGRRQRESFVHGSVRFAVAHEVACITWSEFSGKRAEQLSSFRSDWIVSRADIAVALDQRRGWVPKAGETVSTRLAGSTVPLPGSDVDCLAPRSAQAFRSSSA